MIIVTLQRIQKIVGIHNTRELRDVTPEEINSLYMFTHVKGQHTDEEAYELYKAKVNKINGRIL